MPFYVIVTLLLLYERVHFAILVFISCILKKTYLVWVHTDPSNSCAISASAFDLPAKYGVKIWWACDAATSFPLSGEVYLGRQPGQDRETNLGAGVVKRLTSP
jgi:hypothetical protein